MLTREDVRKFIISAGADLVGFASVDRFHGAHEGHHPQDYLPGAKTVLNFAKRFPNTVLEREPVTFYHKMIVLLERESRILSLIKQPFLQKTMEVGR